MSRHLLLIALLATAPFAQAQRVPVTTASDDARVHYTRGLHAVNFIDFGQARSHFDAALDADPEFALAHMYRGWLSPSDTRAEHLRQATAHAKTDGERQMIEAYQANLRDDYDRERALHEALAQRYPDDPYPLFFLANTEANRDRNAEAVAAARRALQSDPTFAPAYNLIGYAEMAAGNAAAAERAFREQIRLAPDEANPYDSYGEFLLNEGRLDEAEKQFELALTMDPGFDNARTMLARIALERSDLRFEQAIADGDADAIAALYTENAVALPPGAPPVQGRDAIRDLFAGLMASGVDGVDIQTTEVYRFDDLAIRRSDIVISSGGEVMDLGKSLEVWRLEDGEWRYVRDMWSSNGTAVAAGTN
jgi:uncharacterized protein (TIGR02246 family)